MALAPGTRLGHYDVTALLGEGGMGQVWQATDTQLNRQVALKILPDAFADDPDRLARFKREAQILASLNHPNIAAIYGIEEAEGTRALVLELVEGPTLADRISKGPIPLDEALPIAKQIAEALEAAHEQGVIHRDLKPANIKVKDDGTVKVLDFGLAKALEGDAGADPSQSPTLTAMASQAGVIMGTAAYMAPEQARGEPVDKRADIWAFGVVLLEMLTGQQTFVGKTVSDTLAFVLTKTPDWAVLPPTTPAQLRRLLRRSLEKERKARIPDIGIARIEIDDALTAPTAEGTQAIAVPQLQFWQRPVSVLGALLIAVLLTGLTVWTLTRPAPPRVARFLIPLAADQAFSNPGRHLVAISPDGSHIAYAANGSLWLRPVDQLQAIQVPGTEAGSTGPFFSADGQSIGFWADGQLKRVSVSGGAPVTLAEVPASPRGPSWGPDDMILYGELDGIMQVSGASGTPALLIPVEEGERIFRPQMLPGGEWVLFTVLAAGQASWDEAQIVAQSVTTGERIVLIDGGRDGRYLSTGHLVYNLNSVLFAVPFDLDARQVTGGPVPLVEGVRQTRLVQNGAAHFSVSTTGSLVYVPGSAGGGDALSLVWVGRDGDEERIPATPRPYGHPRVSPDGTRVAIDIADGDNTDVWIWDLARETLTQLTFDEDVDEFPLWTPDSARVVFRSTREGGGLFWKAADNTGQVERLKEGTARPYAWATDGRLIFDQARDIGVLTMEGERTVEMLLDTAAVEFAPALSPDGRWLAYQSDVTGDSLIYVRPFPNIADGQSRVSSDFGRHPVWSPDGRDLFYRGRADDDLIVAQIETEPTLRSGTPEPLFSISAYLMSGGRQYDVAPDGDRFIFLQATGQTSDDADFNGLIFVENWFEELTERVPVN